ncbi:hypothetical protein BO221_46505 [Archangium sp. Cb G35]|uniref:hypothetical protein n=1 Tax=Archangium sp. Cb G35 TaxID=1920190 RepID=UPI000937CC2D|nr:hypothetical protein [Archangium sp. Cb G35]OJT17180.1 hypothetical protein BO221_46505 [Archangium sp. Cb G35]
MKTETRRNLLLALVFLAGCAASRVQWVPPALAQTDTSTPRWDYFCVKPEVGVLGLPAEDVTALLKTVGQQGWELVTVDAAANYCLKRPLR